MMNVTEKIVKLVQAQSEAETKEAIKLFTQKQEKILRMAMKNLICKGNEEADFANRILDQL